MFGTEILEIAIGLLFVYLLFSLLATILNEIIATGLKLRANNLAKAIKRMLDDEGENKISKEFYKHPLIKYLAGGKFFNKPSYLTETSFSKVVLEILKSGNDNIKMTEKFPENFSEIKEAIQNSSFSVETKSLLLSFSAEVDDDINKFKGKIEEWFNETMDRATGWYNRKLKLVSLATGLLIAVSFNADTISIVKKLASDSNSRKDIVAAANQYVSSVSNVPGFSSIDTAALTGDQIVSRIDSLSAKAGKLIEENIDNAGNIAGLGWDDRNTVHMIYPSASPLWGGTLRFLGWLLTALAISLGAPFWFDLLNKLVKLRGTGKQVTTPKEKK